MRTEYHTHNKSIIGIEITNNTAEAKDLKFMGVQHRHFNNRDNGITLKNIVDDTLFDDNDLTMLQNWIISVGNVYVRSLMFTTTLLYGFFQGKRFGVTQLSHTGMQTDIQYDLSINTDPYNFTPTIQRLPAQFILNFFTELSQTYIEPGEIFRIIFVLNHKHKQEIKTATNLFNRTFEKDKRKKILLII